MQFIQQRRRWYTFSGILILASIAAFLFVPRNLGIDMTWGVQMTYESQELIDESVISLVDEQVDQFPQRDKLLDVIVYPIDGGTSFRVEVGIDPALGIEDSDTLSGELREYLSEHLWESAVRAQESGYVKIGNSLGTYVRQTATFTILVSLLLIALYLTYSFRGSLSGWSNLTFGIITLVTLMHDVCVATGMYIFLGLFFPFLEIDTFFVTALLTILGYSINDTIVILDRIRSGLKKSKHSDSGRAALFENSIQASVRRSIFTSLTLVIVLVVLIAVGPTQLLGFVVLLLLGTIFGTYSSVFIAAPLVYDIERRFAKKKR